MASEALKLEFILERLSSDLLSADFQWSTLVAAASNYRHDTVLRPFPSIFLNNCPPDSNSSMDLQAAGQSAPAGDLIQLIVSQN